MGQLHLRSNPDYSDEQQLYAAGFLEAYLTAERIRDYYTNTLHYFEHQLKARLDEGPRQWLLDQDAYVRERIASHPVSQKWQALALVMAQLDGLVAGYESRLQAGQDRGAAAVALPRLGKEGFLFLINNGELYDVIEAFQPTAYHNMTAPELHASLALGSRCSALIKVTGDLSDLLMGHSTFDSYSQLTKIWKHYDFALHGDYASSSLSMSSYPGELFSDDDWYMLDNNMSVLSTTNKIFNTHLFKLLHPRTLVSWQRVRVAHMLARSGQEWVQLLDWENSGTYNNQYMVVDLNRFKPGTALQQGLLWVAEQIPGLVASRDMTDEALVRGYWPSYNVPADAEVYRRSGFREFTEQQAQRGPAFAHATKVLSYQLAPRAQIFRRDAAAGQDLASMQHIMRYNNWQHDPYSQGSSYSAVCARGDLEQGHPIPKGCLDSKAATAAMARRRESRVVVGPTTQGQKPFSWDDGRFDDILHEGQVQTFDFEWELQSPSIDWGESAAAA